MKEIVIGISGSCMGTATFTGAAAFVDAEQMFNIETQTVIELLTMSIF